MTRAYALRRLAQQFSAKSESEMTVEDRHTLRKLAREHLVAFTKDANRVATTVKPILTGMGTSGAQIDVNQVPETWQSASDDLLTSARRAESLLAIILGVAPPEKDSANAPAQLVIALAQVSRSSEECQRLLTER
jgi:hypothetical protein